MSKHSTACLLFFITLSFDLVSEHCTLARVVYNENKQVQGSAYSLNASPASRSDSYASTIFNVLSFGAKGDGISDDAKAFQAAWQAACNVESAVIHVPAGFHFLLLPISFSGPCKPNLVFNVDGTVISPTNPQVWGSSLLEWILFTKLSHITIQGNGVIDGRGTAWWGFSDPEESSAERPRLQGIKPTALRLYGSSNVIVQSITIQNSPQCHLKFDSCSSVQVTNVTISSPESSPNTDGIHLQNSQHVEIHHSSMACGDDCVSIQTGCSDIRIHHINCGPGHGISIGGLGNEGTKACVSNVTVEECTIQDAQNGVRIKTWQGGSGSVRSVWFSNIKVWNVRIPIMIDQYYCGGGASCNNRSSAVAVAGITYQNIRGTYVDKALHIACSDTVPCTALTFAGIELKPVQTYDAPFCWNAYGQSQTPTVPLVNGCLHSGRPYKNPAGRPESNSEAC